MWPICVPPTACAALPVVIAACAVTSCTAREFSTNETKRPRVSLLTACPYLQHVSTLKQLQALLVPQRITAQRDSAEAASSSLLTNKHG